MVSRPFSACKHTVSGSLSLPSRGSFHRSLTVLFAIGHPVLLWCLPRKIQFRLRDYYPVLSTFPDVFTYRLFSFMKVLNPKGISTLGLGSCSFARHYYRNRFFYFLFLRLLRCFSSAGSPHYTI